MLSIVNDLNQSTKFVYKLLSDQLDDQSKYREKDYHLKSPYH